MKKIMLIMLVLFLFSLDSSDFAALQCNFGSDSNHYELEQLDSVGSTS